MALVFSLAFFFLAAGIYFYSGKAVNHIAAWKTMPEEEKRKIHIRPLPKCGDDDRHKRYHFFTQRSMVRVSEKRVLWCMVGWMVLSGADVYWIGKSGRFQSSGK